MKKVFQNIKFYKILIGIMIFLCLGFIMNLNGNAASCGGLGKSACDSTAGCKWNGKGCIPEGSITGDDGSTSILSSAYGYQYYADQKKMGVSIVFASWTSHKFAGVDIACRHSATKQDKYIGNILDNKYLKQSSAFFSWDVSGWALGTWNCWAYSESITGIKSRTDFSIWKSTFPTCADVNNYNGNVEYECNNKVADNGDKCVYKNGVCQKSGTITTKPVTTAPATTRPVTTAPATTRPVTTNPTTVPPISETKTQKQICEEAGHYYSNGGCFELNEPNCLYFGFSWENGSCNKEKKSIDKKSKYNIWFDSAYGSGLTCASPFAKTSDNPVACKAEVSPNTTIEYPKELVDSEGNHILGWSDTMYNNSLICTGDTIVKKSSFNASKDVYYYACYKEIIAGYRYAMKDYVADGKAETYPCGSAIWIEYCVNDGTNDYCYYNENGTLRKVYRYKLANSEAGALPTCDKTNKEINDYRYVTKDTNSYSCGDKLYITSCSNGECAYTKVNSNNQSGTVNEYSLNTSESEAKKNCTVDSDFEKMKSCSNKDMKNMPGGVEVYEDFCYKKDDSKSEILEKMSNVYFCENGYRVTNVYIIDDSEKCNKKGICVNDFEVTCSRNDNKPSVSVSSGMVGSNGYGLITVNTLAKEGKIVQYYVSDYYTTPTSINNWKSLNSNTFTIESSPGIKYIWVRDSYGNISNTASGAVFDTINSDTTAKKLELYDANGNIQTPSRVTAYNDTVKSSKYVMLSNQLGKDSEVLADGFNPYDMEYKLEVTSPTITVYATLTSTDSKYVEGYEPRTVKLNYGINTILIKIMNKEGITRTYTILVTRVDDRTSVNTLSDVSLSVGKINFDPNVTDYKIEIPKKTSSVNVKSNISSSKASYVVGYEPGEVDIIEDTTVKLIKIKSETGSTRTYVLTFVKEGTDTIVKESLQLADLVIPNVNVPFESDVANYSFSVEYDTDVIDVITTKKVDNTKVLVSAKNLTNGKYEMVSGEGLSLDVGENFIEITLINSSGEESHYRLTIIRKEVGLDTNDDKTLKELRVLGYKDINFKPEKTDYTVRIKQEKTLVITAIPNSSRAEVFIKGNEELTGFSTVRIKVVAENGEFETYSIDIKKDPFNKQIEIIGLISGVVIILLSSGIIIIKKKNKAKREYVEE